MKQFLRSAVTLLLVLAFSAGLPAVCFAEGNLDVVYDTVLSEDGKTLELTMTVVDAAGLQSGDLAAAYNEADYEYVDNKILAPSDIIVVAGKAVTEDGLVTCSFMTSADEITPASCDENGDLPLVKFTFNVLKDAEPDAVAEDFYMFVVSAHVNDENVPVAPKGDKALASEHDTGGITVPKNTGQYKVTNQAKSNIPWYYIIIGAVVLVGGAVGVSVIVRRKDAADSAGDGEPKKDDAGGDAGGTER